MAAAVLAIGAGRRWVSLIPQRICECRQGTGREGVDQRAENPEHPRRTDTAHHKLYLAEELAGVGIDHQPVEAKPGETSGEELGVDPAEAPEFVSDVVATLSAGYSEVPTLRKPNQSSV